MEKRWKERLSRAEKNRRIHRLIWHNFWVWFGVAFVVMAGGVTMAFCVLLPVLLLALFHRGARTRYYWGWWPGSWF